MSSSHQCPIPPPHARTESACFWTPPPWNFIWKMLFYRLSSFPSPLQYLGRMSENWAGTRDIEIARLPQDLCVVSPPLMTLDAAEWTRWKYTHETQESHWLLNMQGFSCPRINWAAVAQCRALHLPQMQNTLTYLDLLSLSLPLVWGRWLFLQAAHSYLLIQTGILVKYATFLSFHSHQKASVLWLCL